MTTISKVILATTGGGAFLLPAGPQETVVLFEDIYLDVFSTPEFQRMLYRMPHAAFLVVGRAISSIATE